MTSRFDQVANSLPGAVAKEFSETFNVEGHTPLTISTVQKLIFDVRDELLGALKQTPTQPSIVVEPIQTALNEPSILQMQYSVFLGSTPWTATRKTKDSLKHIMFLLGFCYQEPACTHMIVGHFGIRP